MTPDADTLSLRTLREHEHVEVAALWSRSKKRAYPWLAIEQAHTPEEDLAYFRASLCVRCEVWLALRSERCVGFLALEGSHVDQLYVDPEAQSGGIGSRLLGHAKTLRPGGLSLHTFRRNARARAFYAARGFRAVRFGVSPAPESEPDVLYEWP